jgi:hypothetical protein
VLYDGFKFASRSEAERYKALREQRPGLIVESSADLKLVLCWERGFMETFHLAGAAKHKFNAKRSVEPIDGYTFASTLEAERYVVLRERQRCGLISDLEVHPVYEFVNERGRVGKFTLDFEYIDRSPAGYGERVTEDTKSGPTRTEAYQLRKKMLWNFHRVPVTEVFTANYDSSRVEKETA